MKKSYHSSAEPTAEASITRPSDDFSRTTPAPVASAVMVSLPDGSVIGCCDRPDASQPPGTRQAERRRPPLASYAGNQGSCRGENATSRAAEIAGAAAGLHAIVTRVGPAS